MQTDPDPKKPRPREEKQEHADAPATNGERPPAEVESPEPADPSSDEEQALRERLADLGYL
jgi:hypothetical protein